MRLPVDHPPVRARTVAVAVAVTLLALVAAPASVATASGLPSACPGGDVSEDGFPDVAEGTVHEHAVDCVVWWEVAAGVRVDRYGPAWQLHRAQMASFMARVLAVTGGPLPAAEQDHFDDDDGSVHEPAIDALAEAGLVRGVADRRFAPRAIVTRGQMASFLVRVYEHRTGETLPRGGDHFADDDGHAHEANIDAAVAAGFANGYDDGTFRPDQPVRRDEMASFIARVLDAVVEGGYATPPAPDPVLVAVGDIGVCGYDRDEATARLAAAQRGTIVTLGDHAYHSGTTEEFERCWEPSWGPLEDRVRPSAGNHDYLTEDAGPYFDRFGAAAGTRGEGWYSFDVGEDWHVVSLNSNCSLVGGCHAGSPQERWLRSDLAAAGDRRIVAYWHHARFSSGRHGSDARTDALWRALEEHGADLVLAAHEHSYERLVPVDPDGRATADGITSFVVGTGGAWLRSFDRGPLATTATRSAASHGILVVTLGDDHYSWDFVPVPGDRALDRGRSATR
ncbi:MAG: S-layer homology domain-containing protein [Actinobacteria bacterium]|nr:S-layer homology domain-containing protein [Actinomycetota bacterium]